jgi:aryl carrier-like protein
VAVAGVAAAGSPSEELVVFVLHRGSSEDFLPVAKAVGRLINEHTGLEVGQVIPVKRIPKTTSGKVQRHVLATAYLEGEYAAVLAELAALREAAGGGAAVSGSDLENRLQSICETALPGKRIDVHDNLFEIGASSLKLIEIHENIDRDFPGLIDLTELFDHPTIAELAKHLTTKIAG